VKLFFLPSNLATPVLIFLLPYKERFNVFLEKEMEMTLKIIIFKNNQFFIEFFSKNVLIYKF
jgi:hypothetical protein